MRRVITGRENPEVLLVQKLDDSHIIGVEFRNGVRGILKKTNTDEYGGFRLTENIGKPILHDTIQEYIKCYVVEAFVFDTQKEIGEWLIEKL